MKTLKKTIKVKDEVEYMIQHLKIINAFLPNPLKSKELEVLSYLMAVPVQDDRYRFSTVSYKAIREKMGLTPSGLSNYLKDLKKKRMIVIDEEGYKRIPIQFYPNPTTQEYLIKIVIEDEKGV